MFDAQLQQGDEALPVGNGIVVSHLDVSLKSLGQIDKGGSRTCMKSSLVQDHRIEEVRIISCIGAPGGRGRPLSCQGFNDGGRIGRLVKASRLFRVAQPTGEPSQHLNMFVGLGSDAYDQMRCFAGIPVHASRHLHYRNTRLLDQVAVFGQSMWNRNSIAEIGVSHLFPAEHAGNIASVNVPTVHQELTGLADDLLLIGRPGLQADQALINCDHNSSRGFMREGTSYSFIMTIYTVASARLSRQRGCSLEDRSPPFLIESPTEYCINSSLAAPAPPLLPLGMANPPLAGRWRATSTGGHALY